MERKGDGNVRVGRGRKKEREINEIKEIRKPEREGVDIVL